ncbi:MAG: uroporphyrinogen-III synthase [Pseudomonadota bacterium]
MADNGAPVVLITRPARQAERFAAQCQSVLPVAVETRIIPLQAIELTPEILTFEGVGGLILTSENALMACPKDLGLPAFCVGERTTKAAQAWGLKAVCAGRDAEELVAQLPGLAPPTPLLHLHGLHTRGAVAERLSQAGLEARGAVVYHQTAIAPPPELRAPLDGRAVLAPLFSPRSATLFHAALAPLPDHWHLFCLSSAVASALPTEWQKQVKIASEPTATAIISLIAQHISP